MQTAWVGILGHDRIELFTNYITALYCFHFRLRQLSIVLDFEQVLPRVCPQMNPNFAGLHMTVNVVHHLLANPESANPVAAGR
jgi:hypothetical protein